MENEDVDAAPRECLIECLGGLLSQGPHNETGAVSPDYAASRMPGEKGRLDF
jgi:hypothetical protein